jgi:hypothetical protein
MNAIVVSSKELLESIAIAECGKADELAIRVDHDARLIAAGA